jgi:ABC-type antimicrobial peptide transport system permease subunit
MTYDDRPLPPIPVVVSRSFANAEGLASRFRRPLEIGDSLSASFNLPTVLTAIQRVEFPYRIVGIIDYDFPSFARNEKLIFVDYQLLRYRLNTYSFTAQYLNLFYDYNIVWFDFDERQPSDTFINQLESVAGFIDADYAWARFSEIQRDPLSNAVTGMLFAGFWVSLFLSLMDFAFYMAITIRRRALAFATLQAIGWNEQNLLNLLLVEQIAFITPALIIGIFFGMLLATIILPFLSLVGSLELQIPILSILILIGVLALSFALILRFAAFALRRLSLTQVMRFGE